MAIISLCGCNKGTRVVSDENNKVQQLDNYIYPDESTIKMGAEMQSKRQTDEAVEQADNHTETNFPSMTSEEWMTMYEKTKLCETSIVNPFEVSVEENNIVCNGKTFFDAGKIADRCSAQALQTAGNAMWLVGENLGDDIGAVVSVNLTDEEKAEGFDTDARDVIDELRDGVSNADEIQKEYGTLEFLVTLVNGDEVGSTQIAGTKDTVFIVGDGEPIVIDMQKKQIMAKKDYEAQGAQGEETE